MCSPVTYQEAAREEGLSSAGRRPIKNGLGCERRPHPPMRGARCLSVFGRTLWPPGGVSSWGGAGRGDARRAVRYVSTRTWAHSILWSAIGFSPGRRSIAAGCYACSVRYVRSRCRQWPNRRPRWEHYCCNIIFYYIL